MAATALTIQAAVVVVETEPEGGWSVLAVTAAPASSSLNTQIPTQSAIQAAA
jgi:hypothetical protein